MGSSLIKIACGGGSLIGTEVIGAEGIVGIFGSSGGITGFSSDRIVLSNSLTSQNKIHSSLNCLLYVELN